MRAILIVSNLKFKLEIFPNIESKSPFLATTCFPGPAPGTIAISPLHRESPSDV